MARPLGGYIGFNRVPAAAANNSAAVGVWTLREAERFKRAGTWPIVFVSPTQISGLQIWLDAADSATLFDATSGGSLVAADGTVKRWQDKSGNANHATEATNGPQRKIGARNGRDALRFDGANDRIATGAIAALNTLQVSIFTVAVTVSPVSSPVLTLQHGDFSVVNANESQNTVVSQSCQLSPPRLASFARNSAGGAVVPAEGNRPQIAVNELLLGGHYIDSLGDSYSFKNRATPVIGASGPVATPSLHEAVNVGFNGLGPQYMNGDICEVIIYSATLTTAERNAVIDYLMGKWGIS